MSSEDGKKSPFETQEFVGTITALGDGRHQIDHITTYIAPGKLGLKSSSNNKLDLDLFDDNGHPINKGVNEWLEHNVGKTVKVIIQQIPFPGSSSQYNISLQKIDEPEADKILSFDAELY